MNKPTSDRHAIPTDDDLSLLSIKTITLRPVDDTVCELCMVTDTGYYFAVRVSLEQLTYVGSRIMDIVHSKFTGSKDAG